MDKKTPLYQEHINLQAKMAPFAGYDMPIQYPLGVIKEHEWTRSHAGLFDVSHMGQAVVSGDDAAAFFSRITPSSFVKTPHSMAKYTVLTNDKGGIIDDLIITKISDTKFFVVFNAGRKDVDIAWMRQNLPASVTFEELADNALIALQGPKAESALMKEIPGAAIADLGYMRMMETNWNGVQLFISRLGYTGEDGFEISVPQHKASEFWNSLLKNPDVQTVGLAARDSLRLEMGYPLYGHDLNEDITPVEANIAWIITKDHKSFFGDGKILDQLTNGAAKKRVGVKLLESGIAREGADMYVGSEKIGTLTSGGFSPSLKTAIGQGYIAAAYAHEGQKVEVEVRGKRIAAVVHNLAFMPARTKRTAKKAA